MKQKLDQKLNNSQEFFQGLKIPSTHELKLNSIKKGALSMFLKTKTIALAISICTIGFTSVVQAGAGSGGGGGAYQLENGKLVTLPEFGILLEDKVEAIETTGKKYERYYTISEKTQKALNEIRNQLYETIGGTSLPGYYDDVIPLRLYKKDVDPSEYEKVKSEYRQVLEAFDYKLEDDKFVLPAITIGKKTYILPDFERLTPTQQAKYLIHEAGMRSGVSQVQVERIKLLEKVLKVDSAIEKILNMKKNKGDEKFFETLKSLVNLEMLKTESVLNQIIKLMSEELGRDVMKHEIFTYKDRTEDKYGDIVISLDPSTIQETQEKFKLKRNYAEMLEGTVLSIGWKTGNKEKKWFGCSYENDYFDNSSGYLRLRLCSMDNYITEYFMDVEVAGPFLKKFEK